MKTNTSITVYHKYFDTELHLDKWRKQVVLNTMFQGGKGASANKGYEKANDVDIFIPLSKNDLSNTEISIGDIVVKGTINQEITKQSDIKEENYNITTIIYNDYGSSNMNHIQLGAR